MSNYKATRDEYAGSQSTEISIARVGGATDGVQAQSAKIVANAQATYLTPYRELSLAIWNDVTGADVSVTVYGTVNSASLPLNDEIWLECQYLGNASNSLASFKSTSKSHPLATGAAVASDGSTWNGGGSGAGWSPFKLTATLTSPQPQQRGYIYARIFAAKPSTTYYIDPQLNLASTGGVINGPMSNKVTRDEYAGNQITETTIVRSGGAVAGTSTTSISTKIATNAQATFLTPYRMLRLAQWNDVTGVDRTVTVCGAIQSLTLPLDDELWMDCQYLGNASFPLASFKSTTKSHPLAVGASVASDSSSWSVPALATLDEPTASSTALSNGNLTGTRTIAGTGSWGARSVDYRSAGKYYFEVTVGLITSVGASTGVLLSSGTYGNLNSGFNSVQVLISSGAIYSNNAGSGKNMGAATSGDVIGVAIDLDNRKGWLRKNGGNWNGLAIGSENPATNTGGVTVQAGSFAPVIGFAGATGSIGENMTVNTGQSAYAFTPPAGFSNWASTWSPFKLTAILTSPQPQQKGFIYASIRAAKPSTTFYIDPLITLS